MLCMELVVLSCTRAQHFVSSTLSICLACEAKSTVDIELDLLLWRCCHCTVLWEALCLS